MLAAHCTVYSVDQRTVETADNVIVLCSDKE